MLRDQPEASAWAALIALQRKGRVLDASVSLSRRLGDTTTAEQRGLIAELSTKQSEFARLTQQPNGSAEQSQALLREIETLKSSLARLSAAPAGLQPIELFAVQRQLPPRTVLVEYVRYRPFDPRAIGNANRFGRARYSAFVLGPSGRPHWVELGEAATIDGQIRALREALQSSAGDVLPVARALARTLIDPIERDLTGMERLVIAPDSELSVVPFSALQDSRNRFLVQRLEISYVTSGRDLVRLSARQAPRESPLIVADPAFQSAAAGTGRVLFGPLSGTADEAAALRKLLPNAHVLTGPAATETTLKAVKGPRILHVATHGFFRDLSRRPVRVPARLHLRPPPSLRRRAGLLRCSGRDWHWLAQINARAGTVKTGSSPRTRRRTSISTVRSWLCSQPVKRGSDRSPAATASTASAAHSRSPERKRWS